MSQSTFFSRADEEALLAEADYYQEEADEQAQTCQKPHKDDRKPRKRVRDTSIEAYIEVYQTISERERNVLFSIQAYRDLNETWPTAYELYHFMSSSGVKGTFDINSVRPVLTHMKDLYLVEFTDKRKCSITGKKVYTWKIPTAAAQDFLFKER